MGSEFWELRQSAFRVKYWAWFANSAHLGLLVFVGSGLLGFLPLGLQHYSAKPRKGEGTLYPCLSESFMSTRNGTYWFSRSGSLNRN